MPYNFCGMVLIFFKLFSCICFVKGVWNVQAFNNTYPLFTAGHLCIFFKKLLIIVFIIHNLNISYFILRHRRLQAAPQLHLLDKWELHQNNLRQQCCPTCDFFLYCGNSFLNGIIGRIYNIRFIYSQIAKLLPHCFYQFDICFSV